MRINVIRLGDGGSSNRHIKAEALPPSRADEAVSNERSHAGVPHSDEVAASIDAQYSRVSRAGKIHFRESAVLPREAVIREHVTVGVKEIPVPNDSTGLVDAVDVGVTGAGK